MVFDFKKGEEWFFETQFDKVKEFKPNSYNNS